MRALRAVAVAALLAAPAACTGGDRGGTGAAPAPAASPAVASPAVPADPRAAVTAAAAALRGGAHRWTATRPGITERGTVHLPSGSTEFTRAEDDGGTVQLRAAGAGRYAKVRLDLGEAAGGDDPRGGPLRALAQQFTGGPWLRLDPARLGGSRLAAGTVGGDPSGTAALLERAGEVARAAGGTVTGTLDAAAAGPGALFGADDLTDLADDAKAVPFTAALDPRGRLTRLTLRVPALDDGPDETWTVAVDGYGTTGPQPAPPPAEVQPLADAGYEFLDG